MGAREGFRDFYGRHPFVVWGLVFGFPLLVLAVGVLVAPQVFWDQFIWKHFYGPVWADAHQCPSTTNCHVSPPNPVAAKEGYTLVSELTYGIILATSLFAVFQLLFVRLRVRADGAYIAALIPYILLGPTTRVLEDMNVFMGPEGVPGIFAYVFISPVIYVHVAVYTIAFTLLGVAVERAGRLVPEARLTALIGAILATMVAAYWFITSSYASGFRAFAPVWVVLVAALAGLAFFHWNATRGRANVNTTVFSLGLPLLAGPVYLIAMWLSGTVWAEDVWVGMNYPLAGSVVLLLAAVVTLAVGALGLVAARAWPARKGAFLPYANGLNLGILFGHMLDGFGTWVALEDPLNLGLPSYGEKHPVSDVLLQFGAGSWWAGLGFPIAKLIMILVVIWLLDREFEEEQPTDASLLGIIKLAILVLGLAPGIRDMLRVTMGV